MTLDQTVTNPKRPPTLGDRLNLWTLRLAKLRRREWKSTGKEDYSNFYEEYFEEKDVEAYAEDRRMTLRRETINKTLADLAKPGSKILDCGCGLGDVLWGLPGGYELYGFDFADSNVAVARKRLGDRAKEIKQGSLYDIPFETASMDAAMCTEVLEHIEDDQRACSEIARILKPGGFLIAAVPYDFYWPDYLSLMGHFRHYTRQTFSNRLAAAGLKPESYLPNYPNWAGRYVRKYVRVRAMQAVFGRFVKNGRSVYRFKWPWSSKPSLAKVVDSLRPLEQRDATLDYGQLETSTFIVARKPA